MIPKDIETRLENWGRAVRFRNRRGHAMSFEGNYRSPQRNHWDVPVPPVNRSINPDDAWQVEAAWATLGLVHRIILRCHYCIHWPANRICRFIGRSAGTLIKVYQFDNERLKAQGAIELALVRSQTQNRSIVRTAVKESLAIPEKVVYTTD